MRVYHVRIPATTANLGSGFDTLGMALSLYNEIRFYPDDRALFETDVSVEKEGKDVLEGGSDNLVLKAMHEAAKKAGKVLCGGKMELINHIPLARGLGSSSAALVGGVCLANMLMGDFFGQDDMLAVATELEGHPDNVAPAVYGGFCASLRNGERVNCVQFPVPSEWKAVVAIPSFEMMTEEARSVLPDRYERSDCIHNLGALAFLLAAFTQNRPDLLRQGLSDTIHVPYRTELIPGGAEAMRAAGRAGAYGATVSGAGSTLLAICDEANANFVGEAMVKAFCDRNTEARYLILTADHEGVKGIRLDNLR